MDAIMTSVQPFFIWLLQTRLIGSVVIGLILAAQKAMGGKLGPRWRHALCKLQVIDNPVHNGNLRDEGDDLHPAPAITDLALGFQTDQENVNRS